MANALATAPHPDPHSGQPLLTGGAPLEQAKAALILLHGRGASAADILSLGIELDLPDCALLAPQAANYTWYPYSFLSPLERNEPWLSSALKRVEALAAELGQAGFTSERIGLLGFSQGACLALEYAARHARRYGAVVGLSGGLVGPPGMQRSYPGSFGGTPVFLGCSDVDPHIPREQVEESAQVLERMGAAVTLRLYPGLGHTVNADEIRIARAILAELTG
jgi:predicted esterase